MCDTNCQHKRQLVKILGHNAEKIEIKPFFSKSRIKSKLKAKPLTEVRSTISKKKYKIKISNRPKKTKPKIKIKSVDGTESACTNTKTHMLLQQKTKNRK